MYNHAKKWQQKRIHINRLGIKSGFCYGIMTLEILIHITYLFLFSKNFKDK